MTVDREGEIPLPEAVTRTVRHEVGDLLQSLYATVTLLQQRLPREAALEHRLLADLRARGQRCRLLLDTVQDLILPPPLQIDPVDLAALSSELVRDVAAGHPQLELRVEAVMTPLIQGDAGRLALAGRFLLLHACRNARRHVSVRTAPAATRDEVAWEFRDDGPHYATAYLERLFVPFATPSEGNPLLGVALAHQIVTGHRGRMQAENLPEEGFHIRVILPIRSD